MTEKANDRQVLFLERIFLGFSWHGPQQWEGQPCNSVMFLFSSEPSRIQSWQRPSYPSTRLSQNLYLKPGERRGKTLDEYSMDKLDGMMYHVILVWVFLIFVTHAFIFIGLSQARDMTLTRCV